jgi:hypothetical protein
VRGVKSIFSLVSKHAGGLCGRSECLTEPNVTRVRIVSRVPRDEEMKSAQLWGSLHDPQASIFLYNRLHPTYQCKKKIRVRQTLRSHIEVRQADCIIVGGGLLLVCRSPAQSRCQARRSLLQADFSLPILIATWSSSGLWSIWTRRAGTGGRRFKSSQRKPGPHDNLLRLKNRRRRPARKESHTNGCFVQTQEIHPTQTRILLNIFVPFPNCSKHSART